MQTLPISESKWIPESVQPCSKEKFRENGCTIANLIPPVYESYGKLLHPFEINTAEPDTLEPNPDYGRQVNIAISSVPGGGINITEQYKDGTGTNLFDEYQKKVEDRKAQKLLPVSWQSIAQKYALRFHEEINTSSYIARFQKTGWPRNLLFPSEGRLPRAQLISLLSILKECSPQEEVHIYQTPPHSLYKNDRIEDLVACTFEEVTQYFEEDFIGYLYAADKSWIVFTDTDLHCTLIGGYPALLQALQESTLEVVPCSHTTRVDNFSDRINEPVVITAAIPAVDEAPQQKRHSIFNSLLNWLKGK